VAVHHFQPTHYHVTLGPHPPVLRIGDGDSVITVTVDNAGRDAADRPVTAPGNPQTGPFFVEGAEPGDVLAVHFDRIWPNRRLGRSRAVLAPHVVDPAFVPSLPREQPLIEWDLDLENGLARPCPPLPGLETLTVPLRPLLGCFGVAPPRGQALSTAVASTHGGNMDYRGFTAGVTVYFPVFVSGALFHLGDGHAAQGDGEIVGTGIEVSMTVQFTVRVIKGWSIAWPRAEDADALMTIGNDRPLDAALQHATTEMVRWLQEDYDLPPTTAQTLLGQCVEYAVGNVYNPTYTVVCRLAKRWLPAGRRGGG